MSDTVAKPYWVHLIIEGNEEECFFDIVSKFGVHDNIFLTYENADGFGNVAAIFQGARMQEEYDCVLCVYDVDYRQTEKESPYNHIVEELKLVLGGMGLVKTISFCTNPNILQLLLLGCDKINNVMLMTSSKKENTSFVNKYWNKIGKPSEDSHKKSAHYDAKKWQLDIIKNSYIYDEEPSYCYEVLLVNCKDLSSDYLEYNPGSNLPHLLKALKEGDVKFFENINKKLNK